MQLVINVLIIISKRNEVRLYTPFGSTHSPSLFVVVVEIMGVRTSVLTQASPSVAGNEYAR